MLAEFLDRSCSICERLEPNSDLRPGSLSCSPAITTGWGVVKLGFINQIEVTLKEYYPRPLEVFGDLEAEIALDFLTQYPTPQSVSELSRRKWDRFAKREHHVSEARCKELWEKPPSRNWPFPST